MSERLAAIAGIHEYPSRLVGQLTYGSTARSAAVVVEWEDHDDWSLPVFRVRREGA